MELKNLVTETVRNFSGVKSSLPHGVLQSSDAEKIENFVTRKGRLRKIWGATKQYESAFGVGEIKWLDYFRNRWLFQHGNSIGAEQTEGAYDFLEVGSMALGTENASHSEIWNNRVFLSNGAENKFYEPDGAGQKLLNLGIFPPGLGRKSVEGAAPPDFILTKVAAPGSALADATYGYAVTFWDDVRGVESLPWGAAVGQDGLWNGYAYIYSLATRAAWAGMANNAIRVDISQIKAVGYDRDRVTHFIIYRATQADPTVFKRVADPRASTFIADLLSIDNDYYDDSTVEANLGAVLDQSLSPPPSGRYYDGLATDADLGNYGPKYVRFFRDQLWLFGADFPGTENGFLLNAESTGIYRVPYEPQNGLAYASQVGNFDYWQYSYEIGPSTGQKDTGIARAGNSLLFFKERSAYYLDGTNPENYEIRELDPRRGVIVPGSLQETTKGAIGLGADGFTLFDGVGRGVVISEELEEVERINLAHSDKISSVFDPHEERYECHVPLDEFSWNTRVFAYDLKTNAWEVTTRAGGAAKYGLSSARRIVSLLGDPRNGRLYSTDDYSVTTFNGQTMHGLWRSRAFDFGRPDSIKSVQMVEITARAKRDFRISVDLITDFNQKDCATVRDHAPDVRTNNWASGANDDSGAKWDSGAWAKNTVKKKFTILIQAIGKNFNLVVRNSDTDANYANFEIEEILVYASMLSGDE